MLFLDENPIVCASSTPISLGSYILSSIKAGYTSLISNPASFNKTSIREVDSLENLIIKDFVFSKKNRDWIVSYYNTLASMYNRFVGESYDYLNNSYMPKTRVDKYLTNPLKIHSPAYDSYYFDILEEKYDTYSTIEDVLTLSRIILLDLKPTSDEFVMGVPDWFSGLKGEEFVAYDPMTKKHIKIIKSSAGYRYFTSKISDNWIEIQGVPEEINYIISYLISNRSINLD